MTNCVYKTERETRCDTSPCGCAGPLAGRPPDHAARSAVTSETWGPCASLSSPSSSSCPPGSWPAHAHLLLPPNVPVPAVGHQDPTLRLVGQPTPHTAVSLPPRRVCETLAHSPCAGQASMWGGPWLQIMEPGCPGLCLLPRSDTSAHPPHGSQQGLPFPAATRSPSAHAQSPDRPGRKPKPQRRGGWGRAAGSGRCVTSPAPVALPGPQRICQGETGPGEGTRRLPRAVCAKGQDTDVLFPSGTWQRRSPTSRPITVPGWAGTRCRLPTTTHGATRSSQDQVSTQSG